MSRCGWTNTGSAPGSAPQVIGDLTNVTDDPAVNNIPADRQLGVLMRDGGTPITSQAAYRLSSKIDLGSY